MNILFSPLGLTDPISNYRDGAFLHICRFYDIDKVIFFMSKEVYQHHKHDNRYLYCLDMLSKLKNKKIDHELIIEEDLVDVHLFDPFIDKFRKILSDLHKDYPDAQIYLNVSSGTPGMKGALQVLSAFREFDIIPIQVSTPEKKSNPHVEEKDDYRPDEQWDCNDDNKAQIENRCTVSRNVNFILEMKKEMLASLIENYDYIGAATLADTMKNSLEEPFLELLYAAEKRYRLNYKDAAAVFKKYGYKLLEAESSDISDIVEYYLSLEIKRRKEEYADFLRAITPIFVELLEKILKNRCKINVNDYVCYNKNKVRVWDMAKVSRNPDIEQALNSAYKDKMRDNSPISSDHLIKIIEKVSDDENLKKKCNDVREIEIKVRNLAAHEIISVTDEWIEGKTGSNAKNIMNKLRELLHYATNISKDITNSYDNMNSILLSKK